MRQFCGQLPIRSRLDPFKTHERKENFSFQPPSNSSLLLNISALVTVASPRCQSPIVRKVTVGSLRAAATRLSIYQPASTTLSLPTIRNLKKQSSQRKHRLRGLFLTPNRLWQSYDNRRRRPQGLSLQSHYSQQLICPSSAHLYLQPSNTSPAAVDYSRCLRSVQCEP